MRNKELKNRLLVYVSVIALLAVALLGCAKAEEMPIMLTEPVNTIPDVGRLCDGIQSNEARVQLVPVQGGMQVDGCIGEKDVNSASLYYLGPCLNSEAALCTAPMIVMNDRYGTMIPKLTSEDPIVGLGLSDEKLGKIATAQCEIIGYTKFENDAGSIVDFSCPKDWNVPGSDL